MNFSLLFLVGPTATGKSDIAYSLAEKIHAQIISADSMLIYKEPQVITSKPSPSVLGAIRHHMVDLISVEEEYNVFQYFREATTIITRYAEKHIPLIVCGGSGLYLKSLLDGLFFHPAKDANLRRELELQAERKGKVFLHAQLKKVDPDSAEKLSPNDVKRVIRALEVYRLSSQTINTKKKKAKGLWGSLPVKIVGLTAERSDLYERINARTEAMFEQGAVEEVRGLTKLNLSLTARKIIGISEIGAYLRGDVSQDEAREEMAKNTRNFAKRQLTWFRKDKRIGWIDRAAMAHDEIAERILEELRKRS